MTILIIILLVYRTLDKALFHLFFDSEICFCNYNKGFLVRLKDLYKQRILLIFRHASDLLLHDSVGEYLTSTSLLKVKRLTQSFLFVFLLISYPIKFKYRNSTLLSTIQTYKNNYCTFVSL